MKAAVLKGKGQLEVTDFPEPPLAPGCVKIAVSYCGLCGTDLHKVAGRAGSRPVVYPVPLGHEASGVVAALGDGVTSFAVGDRVVVDPNWHCGKCFYCQNGKTHLCSASRGVVKGMAEYICPPVDNVYRVPGSLPLKYAALSEPLSCCLRGTDNLGALPGETVAVIGCGSIGQMMLQILSRTAGKIAAIDLAPEKEKAALENGADIFVCSAGGGVKEKLAAAGFEHIGRVIECVGHPSASELALDIADRGATVVLFGVGAPDAAASLKLYESFTKELTVKFSYIDPFTTERAVAMLAGGKIDPEKLISAEIGLDELPEEIMTRRYCSSGKVIVRVSGADPA